MRNAFTAALTRSARADPKIILLTADHGYALFDEFRRVCPGQFCNAGVAEQNMVGVAAGLAKGGFKPVVYGLAAFIPVRVLEQVKLDVCYEALPVVFVGDGAGFVYAALGSSHQSTEDIAALRAIPNISLFSPADAAEMRYCWTEAIGRSGPSYLRMGKADLGPVHDRDPAPLPGRLIQLREGKGRVAMIATGSMVPTAAALAADFSASVWSAPTLKPIAQEQVAQICGAHPLVVTLEEHSIYGGLGGVVAEIAGECAPTRVARIGVRDRFSRYCGSYAYLLREHGLDRDSIRADIHSALS